MFSVHILLCSTVKNSTGVPRTLANYHFFLVSLKIKKNITIGNEPKQGQARPHMVIGYQDAKVVYFL